MPAEFNGKKFFEKLQNLAKLLILIAPLFGDEKPPLMQANGEAPPEPDAVLDDLYAAVCPPEAEPGTFSGPYTEAVTEKAIASLGALIASNAAVGAKVVVDLIDRVWETP